MRYLVIGKGGERVNNSSIYICGRFGVVVVSSIIIVGILLVRIFNNSFCKEVRVGIRGVVVRLEVVVVINGLGMID